MSKENTTNQTNPTIKKSTRIERVSTHLHPKTMNLARVWSLKYKPYEPVYANLAIDELIASHPETEEKK